MELRNTTDIPTELLKVVIQFAGQQGIIIKSIKLRNKAEGKESRGNWGMYYHDKRISLTVPTKIPECGITTKLTYCGKYITIRNRVEFIVAVLAHELRHAYQMQVEGLKFLNACHAAKEYDAEIYEYETLMKWREFTK
jgi:hypothetical protein